MASLPLIAHGINIASFAYYMLMCALPGAGQMYYGTDLNAGERFIFDWFAFMMFMLVTSYATTVYIYKDDDATLRRLSTFSLFITSAYLSAMTFSGSKNVDNGLIVHKECVMAHALFFFFFCLHSAAIGSGNASMAKPKRSFFKQTTFVGYACLLCQLVNTFWFYDCSIFGGFSKYYAGDQADAQTRIAICLKNWMAIALFSTGTIMQAFHNVYSDEAAQKTYQLVNGCLFIFTELMVRFGPLGRLMTDAAIKEGTVLRVVIGGLCLASVFVGGGGKAKKK